MDIFKEIAALMGKAEIADMEQAIRKGKEYVLAEIHVFNAGAYVSVVFGDYGIGEVETEYGVKIETERFLECFIEHATKEQKAEYEKLLDKNV